MYAQLTKNDNDNDNTNNGLMTAFPHGGSTTDITTKFKLQYKL